MDPTVQRLIVAFVAAYRPFVAQRLAEQTLPPPAGLDDALNEGEAWLSESLTELLSLPYSQQSRGPLEVFQEAIRFPTAVFEDGGVEPVGRDRVTSHALPGDLYGLAPASSLSLGEEAWAAHLSWGAAKAAAVGSRPRAFIVSDNLLDATRIEEACRGAGWEPQPWNPDEPEPAQLALVDLEARQAEKAIKVLSARGVRVVAFGPHVGTQALSRAEELGADQALARSRFFGGLAQLLVV